MLRIPAAFVSRTLRFDSCFVTSEKDRVTLTLEWHILIWTAHSVGTHSVGTQAGAVGRAGNRVAAVVPAVPQPAPEVFAVAAAPAAESLAAEMSQELMQMAAKEGPAAEVGSVGMEGEGSCCTAEPDSGRAAPTEQIVN